MQTGGPDLRFANWLRGQLADRGWRPVEIVKRSGVRPDGKPVIGGSVVSRWLGPPYSKPEKFVPELAAILDVPAALIMREAGLLDDDVLNGDTYQLATKINELPLAEQRKLKAQVDELLARRRLKKVRGSVSRSG